MTTMPKSVLASVGFDALAHNMEAYLSKITNPLVEIQVDNANEVNSRKFTKSLCGL